MKKTVLFFAIIALIGTEVAGQKYFTRSGHIWFYSEAPMENIEAHNYQSSSILDTETGELGFTLLIKGFEFEKALMQEHFNEKYFHSDKIPKSTFEGKILNLSDIDFKNPGVYNAKVSGTINIHGIAKEVETMGTFEVKDDGKIHSNSKFQVALADHDVKIPDMLKDNIAKIVDVNVEIIYEKLDK